MKRYIDIILLIILLILLGQFTVRAQENSVPWQLQPTANSMTLKLPAELVPKVDGAPLDNGDAIGVFYTDSNGVEKCAGYTYWNFQQTSITVYGTDGFNPGFERNEYLRLKIWRKGDNCVLNNVNYQFRTEDIILSASQEEQELFVPFEPDMNYIITSLSSASEDITITYPLREYCQSDGPVMPLIDGAPSYISFTADSGLWVDPEDGQIQPSGSEPGVHTISFESNSCFQTGSFSVKIFAKPEIALSSTMNCHETQLALSEGNGHLLWSTGETSTVVTTKDTGLFWASLTNEHGCYSTDSLYIKYRPLDIAQLEWEAADASCDEKGRLMIDKTSIASGMAPYDFELTNQLTGQEYIQSNSTFSKLAEGTYGLVVTDNMGCSQQLSENIEIGKPDDCDNYVLTPDGDGMDDEIYFDQPGHVKVYNRYGQLKAEFHSPVYWKATDNNGAPLPMGLYIAIIDNNEQKKITVIR